MRMPKGEPDVARDLRVLGLFEEKPGRVLIPVFSSFRIRASFLIGGPGVAGVCRPGGRSDRDFLAENYECSRS